LTKVHRIHGSNPLSLFISTLSPSEVSFSPFILKTFQMESNSKICELYIQQKQQLQHSNVGTDDEKYLMTCKGDKESIDSGYLCVCNGQGVLFYYLHIKCLSLQQNKNELNLQQFQIHCQQQQQAQSSAPTSAPSSFLLPADPTGLSAGVPSPIGGEIGTNFDMANAFAVYRSILLSDMSRLLDEKLAPVSQRLTRLENQITHLQRATHHLSGAVSSNLQMNARQANERRDKTETSFEDSNESKGNLMERGEGENGKETVADEDDNFVVEIVTLKESSVQETEEESIKCEMKNLLSLLRSNHGQKTQELDLTQDYQLQAPPFESESKSIERKEKQQDEEKNNPVLVME
jgi:hypothetical protein